MIYDDACHILLKIIIVHYQNLFRLYKALNLLEFLFIESIAYDDLCLFLH